MFFDIIVLELRQGVFMERNIQIENFLAACDEVCSCKFLIAEHKIQKMLAVLASTPDVCALVSDCVEQFNRDKEFMRAYLQNEKGDFEFQMPEEEFKIVALVFCTLADIDAGNIELADFIKRFFNDVNEIPPYQRFVQRMVIPFRNLIAEAFGYEKIGEDTIQENDETMNGEDDRKILEFPKTKILSQEALEHICKKAQSIAVEILSEIDNVKKDEDEIEDLRAICHAIIMAASDEDFDLLRGLACGLRYAYKAYKPIKFLAKELYQLIDDYLDKLEDDD